MYALRTIFPLVLSLVAACLLYFYYVSSSASEFFERWTAIISFLVLGMLGFDLQIHNTILSSTDFTIKIIDECTAIGPILLLIGAIAGYPASTIRKLVGISAGSLMLFVLNQIRIVNLVWIEMHYPGLLDFAHLVVWQGIVVIVAIVFWFSWSRKFAINK